MMAEQQQQDYFTQNRSELLIDIANKKMETEVQLVRKMVMQLEQELVELRRQMNVNHQQSMQSMSFTQASAPKVEAPLLSSAPMQMSQGHSMSQSQPMQQQMQQSQPSTNGVRQETVAAAPRYGKYTSNDVSIEKFFNYAGGLRKK